MKNKIIFFITLFTLITGIFFQTNDTKAASKPLDKIHDYEITVNLRHDGTLDMNYKFTWEVLDSDSEGPLEWVKIGIPNKHVNEIYALSNNIKEAKYYNESGKTYIRIDFDRTYYSNEIIDFEFKFHQDYMYVYDKSNNYVTYNFTPGWFDGIEVENLVIKWNSDNIIGSTSTSHEEGYHTWRHSLSAGERFGINVIYDSRSYQFDPNKKAITSNENNDFSLVIIFIIIFIAVVVISYYFSDYDSGFGGPRRRTVYYRSSSSRSSSSCACACACACAGGGRAGCSTKDFYRTKIKTQEIKNIIRKKNKK